MTAGAPQGSPRGTPYPGLVAYGQEDAAYFFGREAARKAVIDNLLAYRMTVLYGPSGVGKSSLLHAGVVHRVREEGRNRIAAGETPEHAIVALGSWAGDPLAAVIDAIREVVSAKDVGHVPDDSLTDAIGVAADLIDAPLLIVLDQFEEYSRYHPRAEELGPFDAELARAVARRATPANFLISIREDALSELDRFDERIPGLLDNLLRVDHLDRASALEAIERPLAVWRAHGADGPGRAEPELTSALLDQLEEGRLRTAEPGLPAGARGMQRIRTPYLQLVLARLWDEEAAASSDILRLSTLDRLGGAERIVATHLDTAMAGLTPRVQGVAAQVFRHLVTPSGMKVAQRSVDLADYAGAPTETVAPVLERLTDARILQALDDSRYEIYHDALAEPILQWRRRWVTARERRRARLRLLATLSLAAAALALLAFAGSVGKLELATIDTRFGLRGAQEPPADVVVVGIDDSTFSELDERFPFSRRTFAKLVDRLSRARPRVIVYDVEFVEPSDDARADNALIRSLRRSGIPMVLSATELDEKGETRILGGGEALDFSRATPAHGVLPEDEDGKIRRIRVAVDGLGTIPIVAAGLARGRSVAPSELGGHTALIDYAGPPGIVRNVSFGRVVRGAVPADLLRDKVVVVGATAPSLQDVHETSVSGSMPGPEVHANAIATALRGFPLQPAPGWVGVVLVVALGLVHPFVGLRYSLLGATLVGLVAAATYLVAVQLAFNAGIVLPVVYPLGAFVFATLAVVFVGGTPLRKTGRD